MKKFILIAVFVLCFVSAASAQQLSNLYASWVSVGGETATMTFPYAARSLFIQNGSDEDLCVNLTGGSFPDNSCISPSAHNPTIFQLMASSDFYINEFPTTSVSFKSASGTTASPVSVVVGY